MNAPTAVFELLDANTKSMKNLKLATADDFAAGLKSYYRRDFGGAIVAFTRVLEANPDDLAALLYKQRSASHVLSPPPADWTGVEVLDRK